MSVAEKFEPKLLKDFVRSKSKKDFFEMSGFQLIEHPRDKFEMLQPEDDGADVINPESDTVSVNEEYYKEQANHSSHD
eukprot:CAMPEP_0202980638 /NCGR_PEP_ID=MMETSP1396-20130829/86524_1 /ASSEMBLY_ACC=CAM_ASM_000872 /TAXON_ID= /ORGANISM="Pseudokeronopsis sp., Strain Brazil" /LENGTH=77 /DNA_ID=CAMNT_0049720735 /DNA_START=310 /DNA_END=543 /DNA_ORIENTATION=-